MDQLTQRCLQDDGDKAAVSFGKSPLSRRFSVDPRKSPMLIRPVRLPQSSKVPELAQQARDRAQRARL